MAPSLDTALSAASVITGDDVMRSGICGKGVKQFLRRMNGRVPAAMQAEDILKLLPPTDRVYVERAVTMRGCGDGSYCHGDRSVHGDGSYGYGDGSYGCGDGGGEGDGAGDGYGYGYGFNDGDGDGEGYGLGYCYGGYGAGYCYGYGYGANSGYGDGDGDGDGEGYGYAYG